MQRTRLSEQLLQSSLLQRVVRADRDAIAPATNLLHGEPMTGGRLAHLNLELGSGCDCVGPAAVLHRRKRQESRLLSSSAVTSTECRTPDGPVKADGARPKAPRRVERIMFAFCSPFLCKRTHSPSPGLPECPPAVVILTHHKKCDGGKPDLMELHDAERALDNVGFARHVPAIVLVVPAAHASSVKHASPKKRSNTSDTRRSNIQGRLMVRGPNVNTATTW
jgi:hypothetical protein